MSWRCVREQSRGLTDVCRGDHNKNGDKDGACGTCAETRSSYKVLVGKPKVKDSAERPRCRCSHPD
jgi:hypothetical protein